MFRKAAEVLMAQAAVQISDYRTEEGRRPREEDGTTVRRTLVRVQVVKMHAQGAQRKEGDREEDK